MNKHILFCANSSWSMYNFRKGVLSHFIALGYKVSVVAPEDAASAKIEALGVEFFPIKINRRGTNFLEDSALFFNLLALYRKLAPDFIFHYTIKPNVYGSIASALLCIPSIAVTTGLGYIFTHKTILAWVAKAMYKFAFVFPRRVLFLNSDDLTLFLRSRLVSPSKAYLLDGEGVDLQYFFPEIYPEGRDVKFLLIARMLWDKGVGEFIEAARNIKKKFPETRFQLLGSIDNGNPSGISLEQILEWEHEGVIEYLGATDDVRPFIAQSNCIVLPSYREGIPRILLEAASMARPVICTDAVGCKEVVKNGKTGFLCAPQNVASLTEALDFFLALPNSTKETMGKEGRKYVEDRFDERKIVKEYVKIVG